MCLGHGQEQEQKQQAEGKEAGLERNDNMQARKGARRASQKPSAQTATQGASKKVQTAFCDVISTRAVG